MTRRPATLLLLLAAACGELHTPDLAHGEVAGQLNGAVAGAFVYPLGAPQRKVQVGSDGRFALRELPAGPSRLVLFDGDLKAEEVEVVVSGAQRTSLTRNAVDMPLAGRVVLAVVPEGGAVPLAARYAVPGTDQAGVAGSTGGAVLFPLPQGDFELDTDLTGFRGATQSVHVQSGLTSGVEVRLQVAASGTLGCAAVGSSCRNDLRCNPADGRCYLCRLDYPGDCAAGATCDPATRFCTVIAGGGESPVCSTCSTDAECGGATAYCETAPDATRYCSRRGGCPAGFELRDEADGQHCVALQGCHTYFEEFGEQCFTDETCDARDGIAGGFCRGADPDHGVPGFCTAPCASDADCIVSGFACDPVDLVCVRPAG